MSTVSRTASILCALGLSVPLLAGCSGSEQSVGEKGGAGMPADVQKELQSKMGSVTGPGGAPKAAPTAPGAPGGPGTPR